jgi:hypothetical protein
MDFDFAIDIVFDKTIFIFRYCFEVILPISVKVKEISYVFSVDAVPKTPLTGHLLISYPTRACPLPLPKTTAYLPLNCCPWVWQRATHFIDYW